MAIFGAILGRGWLGQSAMQLLLACEAMLVLYTLLGRMLSGDADRARLFDEVMASRGVSKVSQDFETFPFDRLFERRLSLLPRSWRGDAQVNGSTCGTSGLGLGKGSRASTLDPISKKCGQTLQVGCSACSFYCASYPKSRLWPTSHRNRKLDSLYNDV